MKAVLNWGVGHEGGGVAAQGSMTPLHIASNFFLCCKPFLPNFCHMPTFNTHLVLFFFPLELRFVTFEGFQSSVVHFEGGCMKQVEVLFFAKFIIFLL